MRKIPRKLPGLATSICRAMVSRSRVLVAFLLLQAPLACADYFPNQSFQAYEANGHYPFWSKTWVELEPRVYRDSQGIPYVNYRTGPSYNATTISLFGLQAFNQFIELRNAADKTEFLKLADWIFDHQKAACGCWAHDLEWKYESLDVSLHPPWSSAMTQGLAISVLTRAYRLSGDGRYLQAAHRGLQPFTQKVEEGGVVRPFSLPASPSNGGAIFYEEYPTQPYPSFTLNGFMFSLLGLYDLAKLSDSQAQELFQDGINALRMALPLYDDGDGSSYDLVHLTRPPRPVHRDASYHMVHITLLNALGSATGDPELLWYRDHWNSFGNALEPNLLWLQHFGIWLLVRRTAFLVPAALFFLLSCALGIRSLRVARRGRAAPRMAFDGETVIAG